jgi:hypothetical protein
MINKNNTNVEMADSFEASGINPFDAPTPGASLTGDPENPRAWETPPDFTEQEGALKALFTNMTEDENHSQLLSTLRNGSSIESLVQVMLFKGFQDGRWSPDLMLLLVEPLIYIVMWLADQAGIDAQISAEGDDWDDDEATEGRAAIENDINRMKPKIESLPQSLLSKMDNFSKGEE